jgi:branched-chain amino acid transport system substrate-binding protein
LSFIFLLLAQGCEREEPTPSPKIPRPVKKAEAPKKVPKAAKTGVTDDAIRVGTWGPLTGPAALWGAVPRGTDAYFKMINEEGGIHGRKLKLFIRDDAYQPARTKAAVMELVEKEGMFAFVGGVGTGPGMAVKQYLHEKKIPWIGPATGSSNWSDPPARYLFSLYPTYDTEAKVLVKYLVEDAEKDSIAFLYQNDDYGKEGLKAAKAKLETYGKSLVEQVSVETTDQDLNSHILKLKKAEPDAVIMWVLPKHAAIALSAAAKLGFEPLWATTSTLSDAPMMHNITQGLWEGVIFNAFMEMPDSDYPLIKKYKKAYENDGLAENPKEQWGTFFVAGFQFAEPFVEALKRAGRDLDREKLVEALETLDHWNGGVGHDITFGPKERDGQKSLRICICENGKAKVLTDWITAE